MGDKVHSREGLTREAVISAHHLELEELYPGLAAAAWNRAHWFGGRDPALFCVDCGTRDQTVYLVIPMRSPIRCLCAPCRAALRATGEAGLV